MNDYPASIDQSIQEAPDMSLGRGFRTEWSLRSQVEAALSSGDNVWTTLCATGILLHYNQIDAAHDIVAQRTDPSACLWHAIIHRHEGDYPNARYWVERAGNHPVYGYIAQGAGAILAQMEDLNESQLARWISNWDATMFVKLCERGLSEQGALEQFCLQVQDLEWQVLFHFCYQHATGAFADESA